jgi:hypothetical protein
VSTFYAGATSTTDPNLATAFPVSGNVTGINIKLAAGITVAGTVLDGTSAPVPDVEVDVNGYGGGGSGFTDGAGHYVVGGLTPGSYSMFVRPSLGSDFMPGPVSGGTVIEGFEYDYFEITDNTTGKDVTLVAGNTIAGHISGLLRPATIEAAGSSAGYGYAVEANGDFTIPALWPDQPVQLIVQENPANQNDSQFPIGVYDGTSTLNIDQSSAVNVDVSGGDVTGLSLAVPTTPSVSGHITGADAVAINGWVRLCGNGGCGQSTIAADGSYGFFNLPNDSYTMYVVAAEHLDGYLTATGVSRDFGDADPIVVSGIDVTRDAALPAGFTISGHVSGPSGEPVAGASVSSTFTSFEPAHGQLTDAAGNYAIRGLSAGDYFVTAGGPQDGDYVGYNYWSPSGTTQDSSLAGVITLPSTSAFLTGTSPFGGAVNVAKTASMSASFSDAVLNVSGATVWLHQKGSTKHIVAAVSYNASTHVATLVPKTKLHGKTAYVFEIAGVTGADATPIPPVSIQFMTAR